MKKLLLVMAATFCLLATAQNRNIKFEQGTWQQIKDKASAEKKLIFVDCYTSWCGPCRWMEKKIFTNDTVADYFNQHFVCAKFNMEKGEGIELAKTYTVQSYPNFLFINANGEIVHRGAGAYNTNPLLLLAKNAETPGKTYGSMVAKYNQGNHDADFILNYLLVVQSSDLNTNDIVSGYFATQKESDLSNRSNWTILLKYVTDVSNNAFKYLIANKELFAKKYTSDSVEKKIETTFYENRWIVYDTTDIKNKKYFELLEQVKNSGIKNADKLLAELKLEFYMSKDDYANYAITAEHLVNNYLIKNDAETMNLICYNFIGHIKDKAVLEKALGWSKICNDLDKDNPPYLDTYATLLYKIGKKQEAIQAEEKVLQLTKAGSIKAEGMSVDDIEKKIAHWKK